MSGASDYSPHVSQQASMSQQRVNNRTGKQSTVNKADPIWKLILDAHRQACRISYDRLKHSPLSTWMTMIVIAIALALPASFFSATSYLQTIAGQWHRHVQISLYLNKELTAQQQNELLANINQLENVAAVKLISPEEGLQLFQAQSEFSDVVDQLPFNPLPPVIEVTPIQHAQQPKMIDTLVNELKHMQGIDIAQLDRDWVERLFSMIQLFDKISLVLGLALAIAVLMTIGNTMRLILKKYQKEIELMHMLGANKNYIRRPYLYMGFLYGIGGAFLAWILLAIALFSLKGSLATFASIYHLPLGFHVLPISLLPSLLLIGGLLGTLGAWLTVNKDIYTC